MTLQGFRLRNLLPGRGPIVASAAALAFASWLAGCASVSIEEAVPAGALATSGQSDVPASTATTASTVTPGDTPEPAAISAEQPSVPGAQVVGTGPSTPSNTGRYPNLNIQRTSAAEQLSSGETAAETSALRQAAAGQVDDAEGATLSETDAERLRRLGETHAAETLKQIEGE